MNIISERGLNRPKTRLFMNSRLIRFRFWCLVEGKRRPWLMVSGMEKATGKILKNTDPLFTEIAENYPHDCYTSFCDQLGVHFNSAKQILAENLNNHKEALKQVLNKWLNVGKDVTRAKLESALDNAKTAGLQNIVQKHFEKDAEDEESGKEAESEQTDVTQAAIQSRTVRINGITRHTSNLNSDSARSNIAKDKKRKVSSFPDVQEHLICPICDKLFTDPTNLSCGHVFCYDCLNALDERHREARTISCPVHTCKKRTQLRKQRVAGFPRNLPIQKLLDQNVNEESCPSCKKSKKSRQCITHLEEQRDIFCDECKIYICFKCFKENHDKHATKTKNDFLKELKQRTDHAKQQYQVKKRTLENNLRVADEEKLNLLSDEETERQKIEKDYGTKLATLNKKKESSLKSLAQNKKKWETAIDEFKERGKQLKANLVTAEQNLESETLDDLDNEDLKSYIIKVDTVMDLLNTDINVEHLKLRKKNLAPPAASVNSKSKQYRSKNKT